MLLGGDVDSELFDAAVVKVHTEGDFDVAYDIGDSVGVHLTAEDHSLKLLLRLLWRQGGG